MDLGAYAQIEDLNKIAKENGIDIPRLRGYRLMENENVIAEEEIKNMIKSEVVCVAKNLCCSEPFWNPNARIHVSSKETGYICDYFLIKSKIKGLNDREYEDYTGIRWDRIHGKKRKILKFAIKKKERRIRKQFDLWNKYAGQKNVLYIHSRMGGGNWECFNDKRSITDQPWFLDRVDDYFDSTYCDFYAKIK